MIEIEDLVTKGLNCLEACNILLCNFFRQEYESIFFNIFNFNFNKKKYIRTGTLGSCLNWNYSVVDNADKLYGFRLRGKYYFNKMIGYKKINSLLVQGIPLVIMTSTYYCNWLKQYGVIDKPRYLIVVNSNTDSLEVLDPTVNGRKINRLNFNNLPSGCIMVCEAKLNRYQLDYQKIGRMTYNHLINLKIQENFESCSYVLKDIKSLRQEFNESQYQQWGTNTDVFFGQRLPYSCLHFGRFLKHIEANNNCQGSFNEENKRLILLHQDWILLRNIMYRSKLQDNYSQAVKDKVLALLEKIGRQYQCVIEAIKYKITSFC